MRTKIVAALAVVVLLAGCTGGAYSFESSPASVPDGALSEAGYEPMEPEPFTINESVEVAGVSADVTATSWTATYPSSERQASLTVASTPDATIAGQSVNPVVRLSNEELVQRVLDRAGDSANLNASDVEVVGSETRTVLGTETEVTTFATTTQVNGEDVPLRIHLATVAHEGDVVVLVGLHPAAVDEKATLLDLMETVEHQGAE
ncbi:hypothetical protein GCM10027435_01890 [Haloparvum alkalitolerans]|uniref:DUF6517 family protein n=1 Tax=Haloparvum alkalitolerans TaxID=1042953 RepID=UPI003CF6AF53